MLIRKMTKKISLILLLGFFAMTGSAQTKKNVMVFSKTAGFRHTSIKEGREFLTDLGKKEGFDVYLTENSEDFTEEKLKNYHLVIFLNTTGDVLDPARQADFERFIQAGGGYMGIHAASDTEYSWPWYNDLMGGYFASHPGRNVSNVQNGKMIVLDKNHPSTAHLPAEFERKDEFYDFKSLKKDLLKFLIRVDEDSYKEGKMGDFHPMSWYHEYDGGKAFYTNYGHTPETFVEPLMVQHLLGGIKWAMATKLDYSKARSKRAPEENRFVKTNLVKNLDEPTELAIMPNGKVIFTERKGALKVWNPATGQTKLAAKLNVYQKFEYGLMGIGLDPDFEKNNWVYLFYSPETDAHKDQFLSRFVYDQKKDTLLFDTEKIVLRFPAKRDECCHTGGSIDWDSKGNLYLSSGDDTNPFASDGYSPHDFREGRSGWDALRSSGSTNDLRGKILRIKPTPEGGYTIPEGNLFAPGTAGTRPEIYIMGNRNPYRIAVDKKTDYLYWGDIGPDAGKPNKDRGPEGYVEFNQAKKAGNFGWPMFVGNNFAYNSYDFEAKESGPKFDPLKPINNSPNNTGLKELPPAQAPLIWYSYGESKEFPLLGKGGCNPMGGPVYNIDEYGKAANKFPDYFDGKFFAYEWMRDWIMLVSLDKDGNYAGMERFMPSTRFYHPMDMAFSKDGTLYMLEYGLNWFAQNEEAMLSKIEYNPGNRKPLVKISADKTVGAVPLAVKFSSAGTKDYDGDAITYSWNFGKGLPVSALPNPTMTFAKPGEYEVILSVKDKAGNISKESIIIKAGNAMPVIDIAVKGNKTFFLGDQIDYEVKVSDKEDGNLVKGISPEDVVVGISYLEGFDKTVIEQGHKENTGFVAGKRKIELSDCMACHSTDQRSIGPSYKEIAGKYRKTSQNIQALATKIINGGGGVWGEQAMAAHPQHSLADAREMVDYILSINDKKPSKPVKAVYEAADHKNKKDGAYLIQATYTDKGGKAIGPLTSTKTLALRSPVIRAVAYDEADKTSNYTVPNIGELLTSSDGGFARYKDIDLAGIKKIAIGAFGQKGQTAGGTIEVRYGSKTGKLLGSVTVPEASMKAFEIDIAENPVKPADLYLIFKNPASEGKPLFGIATIEFKK